MEKQLQETIGHEIFEAMRDKTTIAPLTERYPTITVEDAYHISLHLVQERVKNGETIIGKKIGVSSKAVQNMLNVHQPDFGFLTDGMLYEDKAEMPIGDRLIQPKAEGEVAFRLSKDLIGPGVTEEDVINATETIIPCFEVVDSRIENWKIKIQDTVADNASCGLFALGKQEIPLKDIDIVNAEMTVYKNGKIISTGKGSAVLGSPIKCVAWLANTLSQFDVPLRKGEIILSGSWVPLESVKPGDNMHLEITDFGTCSLNFV